MNLFGAKRNDGQLGTGDFQKSPVPNDNLLLFKPAASGDAGSRPDIRADRQG